jgi:dihydrodipicolinate synthase/N-acetylneuraminate lyase
MSGRPYRGVFTIPVTPFAESGELDLTSLEEVVRYCIAAGAHGLVAPVNASEFSTLSDAERNLVVETIAQANDGALPFVASASAVSAEVAVGFARHAADSGADALIAMPPYVRRATADEIFHYFERMASATELPIFIQNHEIAGAIAPALLGRMAREIPNILYIKEEVPPFTHSVSASIEACGDQIEGVFGGAAGKFILEEFRRGAVGTMPACDITEAHVAVWDALEGGDESAARSLMSRLLPLLNFESLHSMVAYKEIMKRRGFIRSAYVRAAVTNPLDDYDHTELDILLGDIADLLLH